MKDIKLVCFDLNKTLILENSWQLLNYSMDITPEEDAYFMKLGREGIITDAFAQKMLLNFYKKSGKHTYQNIAEVLNRYTYNEYAKEIVKYLQKKGYKVALISGGIDIIVEKIAIELKIPYHRANNLFIFNENGLLEDIITINNDHKTKLYQLSEICYQMGIDFEQCACVGDGDNDREIFLATGKGITFKNSSISNIAWKTINTFKDMEKFL